MLNKRLASYNVPEPIMERWEKRFGGRILPLQYRAVAEYGLMDGNSILISAPTSSGKTFCGEMAVVRAVMHRQKAIYLVPLKAVAEEKYRLFSTCYGDLGLRVVIATSDHPENDTDVENGRFDIAVMVYEKFNALLLANFDIMAQVGTIIVDELQALADETRGARLELALTKLLFSHYRPQIVALSAVIGEAHDLAQWLGCRLLFEKNRPVELRRGVSAEGTFYFRCHNSGEAGQEPCPEGEDGAETLFRSIRDIIDGGGQVLIFLKSRLDTVRAAERFVEYAGLSPETGRRDYFKDRLVDEETSSLLDNLATVLACGVAFHNADLTVGQRQAVEEGYREGRVRAVFATTTLSTGINLPASTVFIEAQKFTRQEYTGRFGLEPLSWMEYESMSGRAGRVGLTRGDADFGRAVLLAANALEKTILWDYYIEASPEPLPSALRRLDEREIVIDFLASQLARTSDDINAILERTYLAASGGERLCPPDTIYEELERAGFIRRGDDGLEVSPVGMTLAITGLGPSGTEFILRHRDRFQSQAEEEVFFHLLRCPEAEQLYLPSPDKRHSCPLPERHALAGGPLWRRFSGERGGRNQAEIRRFRLAFLFLDWMTGQMVQDIEYDYGLHLGMIDALTRQMAWLLRCAAAVIRAADRHSSIPPRLDQLSFSVGHGLPLEMKMLQQDWGDLLLRGDFLALHRAGVTNNERLEKDGLGLLRGRVSSEKRLSRIETRLKSIKENSTMRTDYCLAGGALIAPQSIEIDGTPIRERYRIKIDGRPINLTGKSFKYLCRLAWSRLVKENGWLFKDDLEQGFNQARYLYRLRQEIGRDFLPGWPLYENNRSGYYRLIASPGAITMNVATLEDNPDYEIRQMAGDLRPEKAG